MHFDATITLGSMIAFVGNLLILIPVFLKVVGRFTALEERLAQALMDIHEMREDFRKHVEMDDRLFRDINAGLNRLLGRQEAADAAGILTRILEVGKSQTP